MKKFWIWIEAEFFLLVEEPRGYLEGWIKDTANIKYTKCWIEWKQNRSASYPTHKAFSYTTAEPEETASSEEIDFPFFPS